MSIRPVLGIETGFPQIPAFVHRTEKGTPYLRVPGVALISKPQTNLEGARTFLEGFDEELGFVHYLDDEDNLVDGEELIKFAGQLCYASFGEKRTKNKDAAKYFTNIKQQRHGSVATHGSFSFLIYGMSRSNSHEVVRHAVGTGYSQASQRFISGKVLRFVERPEYVDDPELHQMFEARIERAAHEYDVIASRLLERQAQGEKILTGERKTDLRKKVQQAARSCLPNETETFMVMSGNLRAWRHMCEMRAEASAEIEIRELYMRIYECLRIVAPTMFDDYEVIELGDGTLALDTPYRKI